MTTVMPEVDTDVDLVQELAPYDDTDDGKDHLSHIVRPHENDHIPGWHPMVDPTDLVATARILKLEVIALCGYKWVPSRNPDRYPACQPCFKVAEQIMNSLGE